MNLAPTVLLKSGSLEATFLPAAGMLCASFRDRGVELLRRLENLEAAKASGSTAGIPLLYPWANRLASLRYSAAGREVVLNRASTELHFDENGLAIHGVPWGQLGWEVVEAKKESLLARLDWNLPELLAVFPFPHSLELSSDLTPNALTLSLTVVANGGSSVPISFGFHPYFGIADVPRSEWRVEMPRMQLLALDFRGIPTGPGEEFDRFDAPLGTRHFNNGFAVEGERPTFAVSGAGRRIAVTFLEGFPYAQVFAPKDKEFISFEPMTAPTNALVTGNGLRAIASGETFRASFRIDIHSIA